MTTASLPLFYNRLVMLDRQAHARLRFRPPENYSFTASATLVPLLTAEFAPVAREYPIVFMSEDQGKSFYPVALTGMPQGRNLFVDDKGLWPARYVPAYVRRYPFVFAETSPDQFAVCVDPSSNCLDETQGTPLFESNGEPSTALQEMVQRLGDYQRAMMLTKVFMEKLAAAKVLMDANAKADLPDGRSMVWRGFWTVDETKFRELPDATLKEWFVSGEIGLIYAHLVSLGNLAELLRRHTVGTPPPPQ
jgi:SapC